MEMSSIRVYGDVCESCGEYQTFGHGGAGLEPYYLDIPSDRDLGYWLLCDKCRPFATEEDAD